MQYFEMRFDRRIRYFGSILFIIGMILYLPVAIYVPALTFNHVTGFNIHVITPIVCIICTFYTCVGGLKAVIWSDVIQSFVMYGSVLAVCIKGTWDVGGLGVVLQRNAASGRLNAPDWTFDPTVRLSMLSVIVGGTLHKIQSSDVNQISIQRFLSLPSFHKAKQAMVLFTVLLIFLLSCCCYMGLLTYAMFYDCDPLSTQLARKSDQLAPLLVMRTLGDIPGLPGLFVAGVFSAALSSLSTGLNSLACVISQDVVKPFIRVPMSEQHTAILLRAIVVVFGLGCIGLVFVVEQLGMVLQLSTMTSAVSMGPLLGVYTIGVCLPWINGKSALTGSVVSFLVTGWVCVNAQIAQLNGEIRYPKLPVSVEGCTYAFDNATVWETTSNYSPSTNKSLYHLSFLWYTAFGAVICVSIAGLASLGFGTADVADLDPKLLAPFMRRFVTNKQYMNVNLEDIFKMKRKDDESNHDENRSDYFEKRFDRRVRLFGSSLFIILMQLWMPISIYVPALTFNQVTGINVHVITPVLCVVCTFYTCIGGVKGVIWTDVIQSFIMVGALLVVIVKGTIDVGGLGVVYQRNWDSGRLTAPEMTLDPTVRMGIYAVMIGGMVFKLQGICISQPAVQRFLSLPNMKAVKKTLIIFILGLIFLLGLCIYLGLLAFASYYDCDPITTQLARAKDQVVPLYIMQIVGTLPGIPGLFVAGIFSAALSSLSTGLNSLSGVILKDFIEPFRTKPLSERQTAILLRSVVLVFGLTSIGMVHIVQHLGMVMQLSATVGSMATGPLLGIFTIGMMMPFVNTNSVLTGCSVSVSVMAYIAVRAQIDMASGKLRFPIKPVSVEGCTYEFEPSASLNSTIYDAPSLDDSKGIHHISFLWYTVVGSTVTIFVSLLATLYFGRLDTSEVDPSLVVPWVRRHMKPRRYDSLDLVIGGEQEKHTPGKGEDDVGTAQKNAYASGDEMKLRKLSF